MTQESYIWKIVVGGEGGVGKTTLLHRYIHNEFLDDMNMTIGVQMHTQALDHGDKKIKLSLWDLGGQERFRFIQSRYVYGSSGAFICFDMSRYATTAKLNEWVSMFRENASPDIPIVLVGTKMDLITDESILTSITEGAEELVEELGLHCFFPTSSKSNTNIHEAILYMVETLLQGSQVDESNLLTQQASY